MRFRVVANPKGGTCHQEVDADTEEEAIAKADANPNGWQVAKPRGRRDWNVRAYPRESRR